MEVIRVLSFTFILLVGYTKHAAAYGKAFTPPRIFPEFPEYIVESGDSVTLRCEAKENVTWASPDNAEYINFTEAGKSSTITINSSTTPDVEYTYGSILTIQNASYLDTGFYYCHGDTTDFEDQYRVSHIYIYVRDSEHLSVLSEIPFAVMATQHSEAILPCRVTSPDVNVKLTQITGEEALIGKVHLNIPDENGNYVTYDPRKGFIITQVGPEDSIVYDCEFFRDDAVNNVNVILNVQPMRFSIAKPHIEELSGGHTVLGQKLQLRCTLKVDVQFIMEWITPGKNNSGRIQLSKTTKDTHDTFYRELTIENATLEDQGEYICVVKDNTHVNNNTKFVRIFDPSDHFINLTEPNDVYDISVTAGEPSAQWRIEVKAHPLPTLLWYDNQNKDIQSGWSDSKNQKYEIHTDSSSEAFLKINDITIYDRGYYTLKAFNEHEEKALQLFLNVTDKPTVDIKTKSFHMIDKPGVVECLVAAYPDPSIFWFYKPCQRDECVFESRNASRTEPQGLLLTSYLNITANQSGFVMCMANNSLGSDTSVMGFFVSDVPSGFGIWGYDEETLETSNGLEEVPIAIGDTFTLYCAASRSNYTNQLKWYKNSSPGLMPIEENSHYIIERGNTEYSNKISLTVQDVNYDDSGMYTCQVKEKPNEDLPNDLETFQYDSVIISIRDPEKPVIFKSNLNGSDYTTRLPNRIELWCFIRGIPKPIVIWYKDGEELIETTTKTRIQFTDNNQKVIITDSEPEDEGLYVCKAQNKIGSVQKQMSIKFPNKPSGTGLILVIVVVVLILLLVIGLIFTFMRYRKERELRQELKRAGLANFENGALECINPELGIDDQAELLPYDKKWEFPREKLKLGKQLGAGAFGVVMKADANGIIEGEEATTVAVKMVKRNADYTYIKALASELKIMVHLGKHLNVVNLLGACTKNVVKRELLVIVEYCRFGNLHNYLLRHRDSFINQFDAKTGKVDYTFGAEILERSFSISSDKSKSHNPNLKYAALSFSHSDNPLPKEMADYRGNFNYSGETAYTGSTTISMVPTGEDALIASNNSAQPEWRSNYRGDYKGNVKPICTKDLITWAFQVARGMEYLASRKVLHGDLAARNILLAENNIVKICDFGLAKSMYKSDNYKKKGDGPLPVKWMAVESIRDRVFSTQSDVWSYGIVLWEFFSLARTPYPGMEADERLYNKLVDGYRMDSPDYATNEIYTMMCQCWHPKPLCRPSFTNIAETIGLMLEESVRQHYVDLNDPYLVMNTQRLEGGHSDYLAMLSPPDFEHLSSPHDYVNDGIVPTSSPAPNDTAGYLCMKSSHIFSPRQDENNIFSFDVEANNRKHKNSNGEIALGTELLPMLHTQVESDCETPHLTTSPTSFSNPSYHIPPTIEKTDDNIVKSADNYVNMPQNKSAMKNEKGANTLNSSTKTNSNNYLCE